MKLAICISGLMREYRSCRASQEQYLRLLFPGAKLTYFIATWDKTEANSHSVKARYGKPGEAQVYNMDAVRRFYEPAAMAFEPYTKEVAARLQEETGYTTEFRRSLSRFPAPLVKPKECVGMCPECGNCSYNEKYEYCLLMRRVPNVD